MANTQIYLGSIITDLNTCYRQRSAIAANSLLRLLLVLVASIYALLFNIAVIHKNLNCTNNVDLSSKVQDFIEYRVHLQRRKCNNVGKTIFIYLFTKCINLFPRPN